MNMVRIRETVGANPDQHKLVCEMLTVGFTAMVAALEIHASEFIGDGPFSAGKDTPELRKKLDGLPTTSTPCESLFAMMKRRAEREGVLWHDTRVGAVLVKRDHTVAWAKALPTETLARFFVSSRKRGRKAMKVTMKKQRAANGAAKAPERALKLAKKRAFRDKKKAKLARLGAVARATKYSELKPMQNQN